MTCFHESQYDNVTGWLCYSEYVLTIHFLNCRLKRYLVSLTKMIWQKMMSCYWIAGIRLDLFSSSPPMVCTANAINPSLRSEGQQIASD